MCFYMCLYVFLWFCRFLIICFYLFFPICFDMLLCWKIAIAKDDGVTLLSGLTRWLSGNLRKWLQYL